MVLPFIATLPALSASSPFNYVITDSGNFSGNISVSVSLGAAAAGRLIMAVIGGVHSFDVSASMTIGGNSMNIQQRAFYNPFVAIGRRVVDTGTSATFAATLSTTFDTPAGRYLIIAVYGMTNTLVQSKNAGSGSSIVNNTINVGDSGFVLVAVTSEYNNPTTFAGVTKIYEYASLPPYSGNVGRLDVGIYIPTTTETNRLISLTQDKFGGGQDKAMAIYSLT